MALNTEILKSLLLEYHLIVRDNFLSGVSKDAC